MHHPPSPPSILAPHRARTGDLLGNAPGNAAFTRENEEDCKGRLDIFGKHLWSPIDTLLATGRGTLERQETQRTFAALADGKNRTP